MQLMAACMSGGFFASFFFRLSRHAEGREWPSGQSASSPTLSSQRATSFGSSESKSVVVAGG